MRVRTAPPFVRRYCAPGSARCWAGSGHCIRAPNGEQGGIVPFWLVAAGCAAGCLTAQMVLWRVVLVSSVLGDVRPGTGPPGGRRAEVIASLSGADRPSVFRYGRGLCLTASRGKGNQYLVRTIYRGMNGTAVQYLSTHSDLGEYLLCL
jgi:hypothetical protein